ncbi:unnamed protein product [Arabis nemorensis]|uniref:Uncharacterized protein n=1 Tax=Arabis nemorensis TaxID=586526 RepID=A0A565BZ68_9BRAS|nr:unnamed protein product [Arabis nemorensis]
MPETTEIVFDLIPSAARSSLTKRLALLRALSVTKPRLGSSWGLINRRQSSNLTKDAKFRDAKVRSEPSKPKDKSDQVSAEFKQWEEERSEMTAGLRRVIEKAGEESAKVFFTGGLVLVTASSVGGTFASKNPTLVTSEAPSYPHCHPTPTPSHASSLPQAPASR